MNDSPSVETPLGVALTAEGVGDRGLFGARRGDRFLPLRRSGRGGDQASAPDARRRRRPSRNARRRRRRRPLWPARRRGVRAAARRSLRSVEAARRPLRLRLRSAVPPPSFDVRASARTAAAHAPKAIALAPAAGEPGRLRVPWAETIIYEAEPARPDPAARGRPEASARNLRRPRPPGDDRTFQAPRRHHDRGHAGRRLRRRAPPSAARPVERLGLQPGRARRARPASRAGRLGRGARRDRRACTPPASKSCSTSCSTTTARATSSARPYRSAASTTPPISACCPTIPARYVNDTGCGNCLALDRPPVVAMALAALRRWMTLGGFDGFRFDLAVAIGRRDWGFDAQAPLFQAIAADPILSQAKLIAEPWDIGPDGYRLGDFPDGWGEWNDRFRDAARHFWRGEPRAARRTRDPARRLARRLLPRAFGRQERQLRRRPRRLHPRRPRRLRPQAQRGQRRTQSRRDRRQRLVEPRRRRPDATIRRSSPRAPATCAICWRCPVRRARHADAGDGRRARPQPERQQQRLRPGQRDHLDRLEQGRREPDRFRRAAGEDPPRPSGALARRLARAARRSAKAARPTSSGATPTGR